MSYKHSLRLPRTSFAMRANAAVREPAAASRLTDALYNRQLRKREGRPQFVLHDGPPYANGSLHMGHLLNKVLKDIFNRHQLIQGKQVLFVPGWDCHGLPIELKALQNAREKGEEVNWVAQDPRAVRLRAGNLALEAMCGQRKDAERWGVLADWSGSSSDIYRTMDPQYEAAQLEVFAAMVKSGCIHRGTQPVHWSPSSRTALAEAELEYADDHVSPSLFCVFPRHQEGSCPHLDAYPDLGAVVWTTTPWTLPANVALCVHPSLQYAVVRLEGVEDSAVPASWKRPLLVAESRIVALEAVAQASLGSPAARLVVDSVVSGTNVLPMVWQHPLHGAGYRLDRTAPTLPGSHVGDDSGSGIVHTAPGHGQEDFAVVREEAPALPILCPVDDDGRFTHDVPGLEGLEVQTKGNDRVLQALQELGTLLHTESLRHRYPYDWRTKKPILIRTTKQWFASVGHLHRPATDALANVQFFPESARARLQSTLMGRTEWCISRQRAWGVPIPVLYDQETDEPLLSQEWFDHIVKLVREHGSDIWWALEAEELLPPSMRGSGRMWVKGSDTLDVWFDSGSSWRAAWAGREHSAERPADLVLEGSDQHRGWFQSSLLTSVAVGEAAPYKAIVTHGFVLDGEGRKMSKSLGNVVEPQDVIEGAAPKKKKKQGKKGKGTATADSTEGKSQQYTTPYGVDVARVWVAGSDFSRDVLLSPEIVKKASESLRKIRNVARFMLGVLETAETNDWRDDVSHPTAPRSEYMDLLHEEWMRKGSSLFREPAQLTPVDQLMLARIHRFQQQVQQSFASFATARVVSETLGFVTHDLSSFYLDVCKDRLYADAAGAARRQSSEAVIWHCLRTLTLALAPIGVFTAEDIYQHSARLFPSLRDDGSSDLLTDPAVQSSIFDVEWSAVGASDDWSTPLIRNHWEAVGEARAFVHKALETARGEKALGGDLEARVTLRTHPKGQLAQTLLWLECGGDLADVFRVSNASVELIDMDGSGDWSRGPGVEAAHFPTRGGGPFRVQVRGLAAARSANEEIGEWDEPLEVILEPLQGVRCDRCWKWVAAFAEGGVCHRCHDVLQQQQQQSQFQ